MYICINKKYIYLYLIIYFNFSGGLRRCGIGGLIGFSLATAFSLITSRDKIKEMGRNVFHS
jgi:hypothetical protein